MLKRFFGPVYVRSQRKKLIQAVINHAQLYDAFERFLSGETKPAELAYEIQAIFEDVHECLENGDLEMNFD